MRQVIIAGHGGPDQLRAQEVQDPSRRWSQGPRLGVGEGWVHSHVDHAFALDDAAAAHRYLDGRRNIGKVVLKP